MPLFFAISGVFAAKSLSKPWRSVIKDKVCNFLYLYIIWSLIRWSYFFIFSNNPQNPNEGNSLSELAYLLIMPGTGLWFLWLLAIYFPFAKVMSQIDRRVALAILISCMAIPVSGLVQFPAYTIKNVPLYAIFFVFGVWYGRGVVNSLNGRAAIVLLSSVVLMVLLQFTLDLPKFIRLPFDMLRPFVGLLFACSFVILLEKLSLFRRVLCFLGKNTLPIYLAHVLIVVTMLSIIRHYSGMAFVSWWPVPLTLVVCTAGALCLRSVMGRFGREWLYSSNGMTILISSCLRRWRERRDGRLPTAGS